MSDNGKTSNVEEESSQLSTELTKIANLVWSGSDYEDGYYEGLERAPRILEQLKNMSEETSSTEVKEKVIASVKQFVNSIFHEECGEYDARYIEGADETLMSLCFHILWKFNATNESDDVFTAFHFAGKLDFDIDEVLSECTKERAAELVNRVSEYVRRFSIRGDSIGNTWYDLNEFAYRNACILFLEKAYNAFPELKSMISPILIKGISYDLSDLSNYSLTNDVGIDIIASPTMFGNSMEILRVLEKMKDNKVVGILEVLYRNTQHELRRFSVRNIPSSDIDKVLIRIDGIISNTSLDQFSK